MQNRPFRARQEISAQRCIADLVDDLLLCEDPSQTNTIRFDAPQLPTIEFGMSRLFVIEDEIHAELCGEFSSFSKALNELRRRAEIPWHIPPNQCPCTSWQTCARYYEVREYDSSSAPWLLLKSTSVLRISADGAQWEQDFL